MRNWMKRIAIASLIGLPLAAAAQEEPTMTPTPVPLSPDCSGGSTDPLNLLTNGDFQAGSRVDVPPIGWEAGASGLGGTVVQQIMPDETINRFVMLRDGASINQTPQPDFSQLSNFYQVRFCGLIINGVVRVSVGGQLRGSFPISGPGGTVSSQFVTEEFRADLSQFGVQANAVQLSFEGEGRAYIDNVELLPFLADGEEDEPTPSPTPILPTPTPSNTPGPSPTPTPTLGPGLPTRTPTPQLSANSVQVLADPPMLIAGPDDFANTRGPQKQIMLNLNVLGANGEEIDIAAIDPEATVQFTIDTRGEATGVGRILMRQGDTTNERVITTQRTRLADLGDSPIIFEPLKPYDGTVRVIVDIEYKGIVNGDEEQIEIRGVVPIIMRTDTAASLTGATGTFRPGQNAALGRSAGDRGFRPDQRTNLYFRERLQ